MIGEVQHMSPESSLPFNQKIQFSHFNSNHLKTFLTIKKVQNEITCL